MNLRSWGNLIVSLIVICMAPMTASTRLDGADEPWPPLLSQEGPADLRIAMLQYRATATLEKLINSAPAAE